MITLVTGDLGSGKSTFCSYLGNLFLEHTISVVGVITKHLPLSTSKREHGYSAFFLPQKEEKDFIYPTELLHEIKSSQKNAFTENRAFEYIEQFRKYSFDAHVLNAGTRLIIDTLAQEQSFFILDEVGIFELEGGGWAKAMDALANTPHCNALISVRKSAISDIKTRWKLELAPIIDLSNPTLLLSPECKKKHNCCAHIIPESWIMKAYGIMQTL